MGMDTQSSEVDNAHLISVTRGTPASPGAVTWKYWTGNGWSALGEWCIASHYDTDCSGWDCSTQGNTDCTGGCGHAAPHAYCHNGDTPNHTGSGRSFPDITGADDYSTCDDDFGWAKIYLPDAQGNCGCARHLIRIHGDGGSEAECAANQPLQRTHGCVRMRNGEVQTLCDMVEAAGPRVGHDGISVSVPAP